MLGAHGKGHVLVGIRDDLFHFLQAPGGHHKAQLPARGLGGVEGSSCQAEAVHRHGGDGVVLHFKLHAVVDGPGLVVGHGKDGAADELFQLVLGDPYCLALQHVRKVRVVVGAFRLNGKGSVAGADGHIEAVVHHNRHIPLGKTPDNVAKQPGGEHTLSAVGNVGVHAVGDGGLHVKPGEAQTGTCPAEDALQNRKAALLGRRTGSDEEALNQRVFFTGKSHSRSPLLSRLKRIYIKS